MTEAEDAAGPLESSLQREVLARSLAFTLLGYREYAFDRRGSKASATSNLESVHRLLSLIASLKSGVPGRSPTYDTLLRRQVLYALSYGDMKSRPDRIIPHRSSSGNWHPRRESNPRPLRSKRSALSTELLGCGFPEWRMAEALIPTPLRVPAVFEAAPALAGSPSVLRFS